MFPLLVRDGLRIPYWSCVCLFAAACALHKYIFGAVKENGSRRTTSIAQYLLYFLVAVSFVGKWGQLLRFTLGLT